MAKTSIGAIHRANLGQKRHRVTIQNRSEARDSDSNEVVVTWQTLLSDVPASFEQVRGGEFLRGRQVHGDATAIFTVNYESSITVHCRVSFDGDVYDVMRVHKPAGIDRHLELECKATGI